MRFLPQLFKSLKKQNGIFVSITISASLAQIWLHTQKPELHKEWDMRFSSICFLPKEDQAASQRFIYTKLIGLGLTISGYGESRTSGVGKDGTQTSSLKFWSDHSLSLIKTGSGYWQYEPIDDAVIFTTWYDYDVRFGEMGQIIDKVIFRPILGWATALSFDCLRIWLEAGIHPRQNLRLFSLKSLCRIVLWLTLISFMFTPHLLIYLRIAICCLIPLVLRTYFQNAPSSINCIRQRNQK